jgi:hypothetical protein
MFELLRGKRHRRNLAKAGISLATLCLASILFGFWVNQPPPACATDISDQKAQNLFEDALRAGTSHLWPPRPLTEAEISTFKVVNVYRDDQDNWPTYFVGGEGTVNDAPREIVAIGKWLRFRRFAGFGSWANDHSYPASLGSSHPAMKLERRQRCILSASPLPPTCKPRGRPP